MELVLDSLRSRRREGIGRKRKRERGFASAKQTSSGRDLYYSSPNRAAVIEVRLYRSAINSE